MRNPILKPLVWAASTTADPSCLSTKTVGGVVDLWLGSDGRWKLGSRDFPRHGPWPFDLDGYVDSDAAKVAVQTYHDDAVLSYLDLDAQSRIETTLIDVMGVMTGDDRDDPGQKVVIELCAEAITIRPEGYGMFNRPDAGPILIEQNDGQIKVWCWPDVNTENEPVVVDMGGAKLDALVGGEQRPSRYALADDAYPNPCPECGTDLTAPYAVVVKYDDDSTGGQETTLQTNLDAENRLEIPATIDPKSVECSHCRYDLESKEEQP